MSWEIREGDCLDLLRAMPDESVQTCVTSPPYWGLRDYGHGDQLGMEETPDLFVANMVKVFAEVKRVLRDDGTLWLNIGDSYAGSWGNQGRKSERGTQRPINGEMLSPVHDGRYPDAGSNTGKIPEGANFKAKDLVGIPWLLAFALRADGWYLRSEIIWAKPNPMPESVTDRPTKAHEQVFLFTKSPRYFYDADAVREAPTTNPGGAAFYARKGQPMPDYERREAKLGQPREGGNDGLVGSVPTLGRGANKRTVWSVATQPFSGAHFATFPPKLIEPMILAGSAPGDTILDPFSGSGTTGMVALRHDRSYVGLELNPEYAAMSRDRIRDDAPLLNTGIEAAA